MSHIGKHRLFWPPPPQLPPLHTTWFWQGSAKCITSPRPHLEAHSNGLVSAIVNSKGSSRSRKFDQTKFGVTTDSRSWKFGSGCCNDDDSRGKDYTPKVRELKVSRKYCGLPVQDQVALLLRNLSRTQANVSGGAAVGSKYGDGRLLNAFAKLFKFCFCPYGPKTAQIWNICQHINGRL